MDFIILLIKILWYGNFHEIHHLDKVLDSTTGLRIHFAEPIIALLFKLPIIYLLAILIKVQTRQLKLPQLKKEYIFWVLYPIHIMSLPLLRIQQLILNQ